MSKEERRVPELRFKGFHDDWEQRKLREISTSYSGGTPSVTNKQYYDGNIPFIRSAEIKANETELFISSLGLKNSSARIVEEGNILYALYGATSGEVGISRIKGAINQAIMVIKPFQEYDKQFIFYWLEKYKNRVKSKYLQGGQGNLSGSIVKNLTLRVSTEKYEQEKIGRFLTGLDNNINLHQKSINMMKSIKQNLLMKMFSNDEISFPKLRFSGYNAEWKQFKLGDVADIVGGGTPSTKNPNYWGGDIDWYSPVEIGNQIYINGSRKKITELGLKNSAAKILPINTVLFTSRAGIGNTAILSKEGATNQGFQSIIPNENLLDSYFIYSNTNSLKKYGEINGAGSTFVEVSGKQMAKMPILLPPLKEQIQISKFLKYLDNYIYLQERKLDILSKFKKVYLNKMFI